MNSSFKSMSAVTKSSLLCSFFFASLAIFWKTYLVRPIPSLLPDISFVLDSANIPWLYIADGELCFNLPSTAALSTPLICLALFSSLLCLTVPLCVICKLKNSPSLCLVTCTSQVIVQVLNVQYALALKRISAFFLESCFCSRRLLNLKQLFGFTVQSLPASRLHHSLFGSGVLCNWVHSSSVNVISEYFGTLAWKYLGEVSFYINLMTHEFFSLHACKYKVYFKFLYLLQHVLYPISSGRWRL